MSASHTGYNIEHIQDLKIWKVAKLPDVYELIRVFSYFAKGLYMDGSVIQLAKLPEVRVRHGLILYPLGTLLAKHLYYLALNIVDTT